MIIRIQPKIQPAVNIGNNWSFPGNTKSLKTSLRALRSWLKPDPFQKRALFRASYTRPFIHWGGPLFFQVQEISESLAKSLITFLIFMSMNFFPPRHALQQMLYIVFISLIYSLIYFASCVLENNDLNEMLICIQICRKENRIVLTSGLPYRMVSLDLALSCVISR